MIKSYNPANNKLLGQIEEMPLSKMQKIVRNSQIAFESWGYLSLEERLSYIEKLYDEIAAKK